MNVFLTLMSACIASLMKGFFFEKRATITKFLSGRSWEDACKNLNVDDDEPQQKKPATELEEKSNPRDSKHDLESKKEDTPHATENLAHDALSTTNTIQ